MLNEYSGNAFVKQEANFGETENSNTISQEIALAVDAAIENCFAVSGGGNFFDYVDNAYEAALRASYGLYEQIADNKVAERYVLENTLWQGRKRKPNEGSPALLSLLLTLNPPNQVKRNKCSEHANYLIAARILNTKASDFTEFYNNTTLVKCKSIARVRDQEPEEVESASVEQDVEEVGQVLIASHLDAVLGVRIADGSGLQSEIVFELRFVSNQGQEEAASISLPRSAVDIGLFQNLIEQHRDHFKRVLDLAKKSIDFNSHQSDEPSLAISAELELPGIE